MSTCFYYGKISYEFAQFLLCSSDNFSLLDCEYIFIWMIFHFEQNAKQALPVGFP